MQQKLPATADASMTAEEEEESGPLWRARKVAEDAGYVAHPLACSSAAAVASYAMLKCEELFGRQCWLHSLLTPVQRELSVKYPVQDFNFWVKFGSWSRCPYCGVLHFNDKYFSERVYQDVQTSSSPDHMSAFRRMVPSDPQEHSHGQVGPSSRWWYLKGMFKPVMHCGYCTKVEEEMPQSKAKSKSLADAGMRFAERLRRTRQKKLEATAVNSAAGVPGQAAPRTGELYRVPCLDPASKRSLESVCWPRYRQGQFADVGRDGVSMLELTLEECRALQIICLRTQVKAQRYGGPHHTNWKKVGLSTAYFKRQAVTEASMPTPRAVAALRYLLANNEYYKTFWDKQKALLEADSCLSISSFDLFITHVGIECAMCPVLYPKASWSDTGGLKHYKAECNDSSTRTVSIGRSRTRKVCSSVRVYAEQRDLTFFCMRSRWR